MRKFLLCMSVAFLFLAIITSWMCSIWAGVIASLVLGALITFDIFLFRINAKWGIIIVMLILSIILMFWRISALNMNNGIKMSDDIKYEQNEKTEEDETNMEDITEEEPVKEESVEEEPAKKEEPKEKTEPIVITKVVEVPKEVVKYVEVEKENVNNEIQTSNTTTQTVPPTTSQNNTNNNIQGNNYGYGNYNPYGDPMGGYSGNNYNSNNNYYGSNTIRISGEEEVIAGEEYTYTISGVSSISKSKLKVPANVSIENIRGNKVTLYFEEGWTGTYSIGYGSSKIKVEVYDD